MNKGMFATAMSGLLDPRLKNEERDHNLRFLQVRWVPGMLGETGDWVWDQAIKYVTQYRVPMSFKELGPMLDGEMAGDPEIMRYCEEYTAQGDICTTSQFKHAFIH